MTTEAPIPSQNGLSRHSQLNNHIQIPIPPKYTHNRDNSIPVAIASYSHQISQSNNEYPHFQPHFQITLPHPWKAHFITPRHQYNPILTSHPPTTLILPIQQRQPIPFDSAVPTPSKFINFTSIPPYQEVLVGCITNRQNNLKEWKGTLITTHSSSTNSSLILSISSCQ